MNCLCSSVTQDQLWVACMWSVFVIQYLVSQLICQRDWDNFNQKVIVLCCYLRHVFWDNIVWQIRSCCINNCSAPVVLVGVGVCEVAATLATITIINTIMSVIPTAITSAAATTTNFAFLHNRDSGRAASRSNNLRSVITSSFSSTRSCFRFSSYSHFFFFYYSYYFFLLLLSPLHLLSSFPLPCYPCPLCLFFMFSLLVLSWTETVQS